MNTLSLTRQPNTVNFVTTVTMPAFSLAPAHRVSLLDLIIKVLTWLLGLAITLKVQPACCDNPSLKPQEQGYAWCTNCGAVFDSEGHQRPRSRQERLNIELDRSLAAGHLVN